MNAAKYLLKVQSVKFLGHIISEGTVQPDPDMTKAIREMPDLSNRILGVTDYLQKFIPQFSEIIQPLRELLKNGNEWIWGDKQKKAMETIKQELTQ
ncbi:hypothetical protein PR048_009601 [Dryococelus australis]|uniref:Uncharacterized protein n=1 Tax=Dryococelus australis TaxID=614101 RepID=A0ABQ9I1B8_9NEOP|nr:hypothetical protein PR048_009601 [Dryococelus australis]